VYALFLAGSMILIHGQLVHWSHGNTSEHPRNAFSLHVIEGSYNYPASNWYDDMKKFNSKHIKHMYLNLNVTFRVLQNIRMVQAPTI
jgi:hypothetical protein